jgi:hypothetical protein
MIFRVEMKLKKKTNQSDVHDGNREQSVLFIILFKTAILSSLILSVLGKSS